MMDKTLGAAVMSPVVMAGLLIGVPPAHAQWVADNSRGVVTVPNYPGSVKTSAHLGNSPFGFPTAGGVQEFMSTAYRVPTSAATAERWFTRALEQRGYRVLSQAESSDGNVSDTIQGIEFGQGIQNNQEIALNFRPVGPHACFMAYETLSYTPPTRPASTKILNPQEIADIRVVYHPWRYGASAQDFVLRQRKKINQIVRILNALPPSSPFMEGCADDFGQGATLTVDFIHQPAWVIQDNAACETVSFPGAPPLTDTAGRLYHALGVDAAEVFHKT
ncbi:hypothetical protein [Sulfobacillus sp. hq2]|uniref:hypothetical protein n=1 Tax=Sulfobacillus TaxID=28033 RepID=UPI0011AFAAFA|nr:hypothetical protein [Sulfobacillus sp. hq2]